MNSGTSTGTGSAPGDGGRWLAPGVPVLAGTVAVVSILTGALMAAVAVAGHAFTPWVSAGPLGPGLVGAAMLGVSPGLLLVGRARRWEEVRTLMLPTAVVLLGLLTVSLVNGGRLYLVHGGSIVLVLFSLGWIGTLALLALGALVCLLLQYLTPAAPVRERIVPVPGWAKPFLAVLGSSWSGIGAGLLLLPGFWGALLPWRVDRADAQALGVWALALGVGVLGGLVEDDLARLRPALLSLPGVAVVAGVLLATRSGEVHWASGPGVSLITMLTGLLVCGGTGYWLLARSGAGRPAGSGG
ncbi:hypothetical protein LN042_21025 [Kitasatospora sp. RB6PN24]|uniref:hypothetical protein n=1 Tax=Kitasatospora humi TaxID=2893891 RepID=UPI001E5F7350|nr:hypothetical protein [Kitasatospora humi]MCC9309529.1 hypothetical protein [Kitasatospora humi]